MTKATKSASTPLNTRGQQTSPSASQDLANSEAQRGAITATRPSIAGASVVEAFGRAIYGELDISALAAELSDDAAKVRDGDMRRPEAMLLSQAHALQSIFVSLARRAAVNMGEYMGAADTYLRLALKAQSQCRSTLEALAEIKNPRQTSFVRQQNVANGPQQVNNGATTSPLAHARTETLADQTNEQLAVTHEQSERLDPGATGTASGRNSAVEAVGAIQRPSKHRR